MVPTLSPITPTIMYALYSTASFVYCVVVWCTMSAVKKQKTVHFGAAAPRAAELSATHTEPKQPTNQSRAWNALPVPLHAALRGVLSDLGFHCMTPVQSACLPALLQHNDVTVQAATGSGKTLAYVLPTLQICINKLIKQHCADNNQLCDADKIRQYNSQHGCSQLSALPRYDCNVLVISPTRELATQIHDVYKQFISSLSNRIALFALIGGDVQQRTDDAYQLAGGNVIVATPGKLQHTLAANKLINTKSLECLILDEADRLLDMGFEQCIVDILHCLPKQRRTGLFSATLSSQLNNLIKAGLRNPVRIDVQIQWKAGAHSGGQTSTPSSSVTNQVIPTTLHNYYTMVEHQHKLAHLVQFIAAHGIECKIIVFFLTCAQVNYLTIVLNKLHQLAGIHISGLHGKLDGKKRHRVYQQYVAQSAGVLLCTDVAARGIDLPDVHYIVQYDAPQDPAYFVHRIGRTARMNRSGTAIVYLTPQEDTYIQYLQLQRIPIQPYTDSVTQPTEQYIDDVYQQIVSAASSDRLVFHRAQTAYVSYLRAYREHQLSQIFDYKQLPYADVAHGMALLYMPQVKELAHLHLQYACKISGIPKPSQICFADRHLEQQRLHQLQQQHQANAMEQAARLQAQQEREAVCQQRSFDLQSKRRVKSSSQQLRADWLELADDHKAIQKRARGKQLNKYTEEELEAALMQG